MSDGSSSRRRSNTHIGVAPELFKLLGAQAGGEAVEGVRVGVVGIGGNALNGGVDGVGLDLVLHLDDVLALDELGIARDDDGSGRGAPGGGGNGQGEESEKSCGAHIE